MTSSYALPVNALYKQVPTAVPVITHKQQQN